jgi:hypothetical protein
MPSEPIEKSSFVTRIEPEPGNDRPDQMRAFAVLVTGPIDSVHIERMDGSLYSMVMRKGDEAQRITIGATDGRSKVAGRTELE